MSSSRVPNAHHCWFMEDGRTWSKTLNIPARAISAANFNTKYPIYLEKINDNHLVLTQDCSSKDIITSVNGWTTNGRKYYRIGAQTRFNPDTDSVMCLPDAESRCIDLIGVNYYEYYR